MKIAHKYKKTKKDEKSYYELCFKQIAINRQQQDRFIGTLMLLAYEGCITDGRARELAQMDIYEWRKECARMMRQVDQEPT